MTTTTVPHTDPITARAGTGRSEVLAIAGWVLTGFVGSFLLFDGASRLLQALAVVDTSAVISRRPEAEAGIAIIELAFLALYLMPRTSLVGAILLTAYLGGELAINAGADAPIVGYVGSVGIMLWASLQLRNPQLRRLMPFGRRPRDQRS